MTTVLRRIALWLVAASAPLLTWGGCELSESEQSELAGLIVGVIVVVGGLAKWLWSKRRNS